MAVRVREQFGNYTLDRLLGQGKFAQVYLGKHRYLDRQAAIKVLKVTLQDEEAREFRAEAQTLVDLEHPNIVHVLDFTVEQGVPALIMDYARGVNASTAPLRYRSPHGNGGELCQTGSGSLAACT